MSYSFNNNQFIIEDYDKKKTFSSFLPGIAGIKGIPLWAFYANRGQGITSFGIRDKDQPILEFFPANTSYQYVDKYGFRSFVAVDGEVYEPFTVNTRDVVKRNMAISRGHFTIEEINESRQIHYKVTYFGLTNEPVAGLVRKVDIKNVGPERQIDVVDGIASILPSGATNAGYKEMSNLMVSWMGVENLENKIPYYKFRLSSDDESEVSMIDRGHFYMSFVEDQQVIRPIVDLGMVFGYDTSLTLPIAFEQKGIKSMDLENQVLVNKVPCGFTPVSKSVASNQTIQLNTIIGHVSDIALINKKVETFATQAYIDQKLKEAEHIIDQLVDTVDTQTAFPLFNDYIKQNFLDNMLRGGYPMVFGEHENPKIYHVYSRKHGDPERDYNFFTLSPEFYSQGNGNFRDVNQNRRNDVFFVPEAGLFNVKTFMNLIQLDGYNPLDVKGTTFTLEATCAEDLISEYVVDKVDDMTEILTGKFTPGQISMGILLNGIKLNSDEDAFINRVLAKSTQHIEAVFGEGFWVDHWTYNFDLIENYLSVFPDKLNAFLHEDKSYQYYESPVRVLPRTMKYGLTDEGTVRQYGAIEKEPPSERYQQSNWVRMPSGQIYLTNLAQKLMTLVLTKFSSLDPLGMGIEMEANKPGWNDAMNGLPGVFGSDLSENLELIRVVCFLKNHLSENLILLKESAGLFQSLKTIIESENDYFKRWDKMTTARETYRAQIQKGISGEEVIVSKRQVLDFLTLAEEILLDGIDRAKANNEGIIPTYLAYKASAYDCLDEMTPYGLRAVNVKAFEVQKIPDFLEAPARSFKVGSVEENRRLYQKIKATDLYDQALKTYRTSRRLDEMNYELGRIRAFTPGWLERESNFLHMTYKYLLGLLKGGLYDAFFEEIKSNLVCFMNPDVYGRSTLENSSFIASSLNPNPSVVGQGFVARLSGSTAEMLSIWQLMMFGKNLFTYKDELIFSPQPLLTPDFFINGYLQTTLLSTTTFIIENQTHLPTYSEEIEVAYYCIDGQKVKEVKGQWAEKVRCGQVKVLKMVYQMKTIK